jgi:hypothetical protein
MDAIDPKKVKVKRVDFEKSKQKSKPLAKR